MKVSDILAAKGRKVVTVSPATRVRTAALRLRAEGVGSAVVSEDGRTILGLISERELVHGMASHGEGALALTVQELMLRSIPTCHPDDGLRDTMTKMTRHRARHLPVVEDGKLCGVISVGDVVKSRLEELELEAGVLRDLRTAAR